MKDAKPRKKKMSLRDKAVAAMFEAVAGVIEEHRRNNMPLLIWENGRIVKLPPDQAVVPKKPDYLA